MRKTSARPGGDRRNARPGRPGAKPTGKNTGREARSERPAKDGRDQKKDRPFSKGRPHQKERPDSGERKFSKDRPYSKDRREKDDRSFSKDRPYSKDRREKDDRSFSKDRPYSKDRRESGERSFSKDRPYSKDRRDSGERSFSKDRPYSKDRRDSGERSFSKDRPYSKERSSDSRVHKPEKRRTTKAASGKDQYDDSIRLNRFIANSGVCSRREADQLIKNGAITVNGQIVTEMGIKVKPGDVVMYGTQKLINEKKVYILLNKPKDYITTSDDPHDRKTVIELIRNACRERVYPVGRLDRNTTGLLLLTNDGDLAKKLTHPRHGVRKLYHVHLDQPVKKADLDQVAKGVKIDDNLVVPDDVSYIDRAESKKEIGIEIHSGQNRVVRRIFEQLGYKVTKLDRVIFAGLTKRDLPRGKWRFLTEKEVSFLKMQG